MNIQTKCTLGVLAAATFLAGCAVEKPTPATLDSLNTPEASQLIGKSLALPGNITFKNEVDASYWFQPPPIMISDGKNITYIPQSAYYVSDTDYVYDIVLTSKEKVLRWENVRFGDKKTEGSHTIIARFNGYDYRGYPQLSNLECP